jgi:hypothetical protein
MTVLLVLLFISIFIVIDEIRQHRAKHVVTAPKDAFVHEWGLSLADGGERKKEIKKKEIKTEENNFVI